MEYNLQKVTLTHTLQSYEITGKHLLSRPVTKATHGIQTNIYDDQKRLNHVQAIPPA